MIDGGIDDGACRAIVIETWLLDSTTHFSSLLSFYLVALVSGGGTASCRQDVKKESSWMTIDIPVRMYSLHILRTQRSSVGDRPEPFFGVLSENTVFAIPCSFSLALGHSQQR